jgi:hypothetical protein
MTTACEREQSDEATHSFFLLPYGFLRGVYHRARAFARPVGSQRRTGGASRREVANVYLDFTLYLFVSSMRGGADAAAAP